MKETKTTDKKNNFDIKKELRKFLMSSENCIPTEEAIKNIKEKWPEVDIKNPSKKQ